MCIQRQPEPQGLFDKCPSCDASKAKNEVVELVEVFLDCIWHSMKCLQCGYTETRDVRLPVQAKSQNARVAS